MVSIPTARIIVSEKRGVWASSLRRVLTPLGPRVYETRSLDECWTELSRSPASCLCLEVTPGNAEALLTRLFQLSHRFPLAQALVVGTRDLRRLEWVLREAGAVHVAFSTRSLAAAAGLMLRHLAQAPPPDLPWREAVWQRLPWGGAPDLAST